MILMALSDNENILKKDYFNCFDGKFLWRTFYIYSACDTSLTLINSI